MENYPYYDKEGKKISNEKFIFLFKDFSYRSIASTYLPNGKWISTIWLGIDHSFDEKGKLIFETMVFPSKENFLEEDLARYSTLTEAIEGHKRMVEKWKEKI